MSAEQSAQTTDAKPQSENETTAPPASHHHGGATSGSRFPLLINAWYSTSDLATRLHLDASTLRRWRTAQPPQGPPFVSISERVVMYSSSDVEGWLHSRRTVPTKGINGR